jgi:hypothetical protein
VSADYQCPTCGARQELRNPGVVVLVCAYCQTTLYREDAALRAGERSIVAEPRSAIRVGGDGKLLGERVVVVGRLQFSHDSGHWDEWLLESPNGDAIWLVEDAKSYTLEIPYEKALPEGAADTSVGHSFVIGGQSYTVRETGWATCSGGEGQLPRGFTPGERTRYIDAATPDGAGVFTMEVDSEGEVSAWSGRPVPFADVEFKADEVPHTGPAEAARNLSCPECGGQLGWPTELEQPKTLACSHCTAVLNLSDAHPTLTGKRNCALEKHFDLEIGDQGEVLGTACEVIGRLYYSEHDSDPTLEYLLWSKAVGYRWLAHYAGNWTVAQPTGQGPPWTDVQRLKAKDKVEISGTTFQFFERGSLELKYVDGALPWEAALGDRTQYATFISPSRGITLEKSGSEVECFVAQHVDGQPLLESFGRADKHCPPWEIGALRPNPLEPWKLRILAVIFLFGVGNLLLASSAHLPGADLVRVTVSGSTGDEPIVSEPFSIPEGTHIIGFHLDAAVDNGWVYVTGELLDSSGESVLGVTGAEVSYYHGYSGGESWSEGSKSERALLRAPAPGTYRFAVSKEGDQAAAVQIALTRGDRMVRYPLILGLLLLFYPCWAIVKSAGFESRRWGVGEDD